MTEHRAVMKKENLYVLSKYVLNDLLNYPLPKPHYKPYKDLSDPMNSELPTLVENGMSSKPMESYILISHGHMT